MHVCVRVCVCLCMCGVCGVRARAFVCVCVCVLMSVCLCVYVLPGDRTCEVLQSVASREANALAISKTVGHHGHASSGVPVIHSRRPRADFQRSDLNT